MKNKGTVVTIVTSPPTAEFLAVQYMKMDWPNGLVVCTYLMSGPSAVCNTYTRSCSVQAC